MSDDISDMTTSDSHFVGYSLPSIAHSAIAIGSLKCDIVGVWSGSGLVVDTLSEDRFTAGDETVVCVNLSTLMAAVKKLLDESHG